jgi:cytochrome c556
MKLIGVWSLSCLLVSSVVVSNPIEDQIRIRQSTYAVMGWNTGKIKNQIVDHPETYHKDQIIAAANTLSALAHSNLLEELYGVGTDQGTGWKPTRLKADYFQKQEEVKEINARLIKETDELKVAADTGDVAAIKSQFGKLGATCKSCHDLIRVRE